LILTAGCSSYSKYQAGEAAASLFLAAAVLAAQAVSEQVSSDLNKVDKQQVVRPARVAHAVLRRQCTGTRSFVLLCYEDHSCYYETNEGQRYDAVGGEDPVAPPELLEWCDGPPRLLMRSR
jgi:hypothetical protein